MAKYNIFKILDKKISEFEETVESLVVSTHDKTLEVNQSEYEAKLFYFETEVASKVKWHWILTSFDKEANQYNKVISSILQIKVNDDIYVMTFGNSYHKVAKFCDKDFPFRYARKLKYDEISLTSHSSPNTNKTKVINSYIKKNMFEYESGEAFLKVKGKISKDSNTLIKQNIEIGNSLKISCKEDSLEKLIDILLDIQTSINSKIDQTKIPVFREVVDDLEINKYNDVLFKNINEEQFQLKLSDFDIIGTTEIFYNHLSSYRVICGKFGKDFDELSIDIIKEFCEEKNIIFADKFFDIKIKCKTDEGTSYEKYLRELVDFQIDDSNIALINGIWYEYNSDYLETLHTSLDSLELVHNNTFDWDDEYYNQFIENKILERKDEIDYDYDKCAKEVKRTYYKEKVYNLSFEDKGYACLDTKLEQVDSSYVEVADLYKDDTIYSVKIGCSSSKFCYVIDQIELAMKLIKDKKLKGFTNVKTFCIVLIYETSKFDKFYNKDNKLDFRLINLLAFKNALDNWQKEVRKRNYIPKVIIAHKKK